MYCFSLERLLNVGRVSRLLTSKTQSLYYCSKFHPYKSDDLQKDLKATHPVQYLTEASTNRRRFEGLQMRESEHKRCHLPHSAQLSSIQQPAERAFNVAENKGTVHEALRGPWSAAAFKDYFIIRSPGRCKNIVSEFDHLQFCWTAAGDSQWVMVVNHTNGRNRTSNSKL